MKFPKESFEEPKIAAIPIVDVLLAVFLFLAILAFKEPFISVFVHLPEGQGQPAQLKTVNILIDRKGHIYLGKERVDLKTLKEKLKGMQIFAVNVLADERTPYKYVAEVLSTLQSLKIINVNLILKEKG